MITADNLDEELKKLAFNFFYRFSRFEFALKDNKLVKRGQHGIAQPDWKKFVEAHERNYVLSQCARELIDRPPDVQRYKNEWLWEWAPLTFTDGVADLPKVVFVVKTVRNNLFHGGKHSAEGWDDPERVQFLLSRAITVLDELAEIGGLGGDYRREY